MSSGSTPPPSALAGISAQAKIDQIGVRIIALPDGIRDPKNPARISGQIARQNSDGTVDIRTGRGDIRVLLRDRGALPQGLQIDIDIPAGRNPQQANIRQSDLGRQQTSPTALSQIARRDGLSASPLALPAFQIESETLGNVIGVTQAHQIDQAGDFISLAGGVLQSGQVIRFLPATPESLPSGSLQKPMTPITTPDFISAFVTTIDLLPKDQAVLRTTMIAILARMDLSGLKTMAATATASSLSGSAGLLEKINSLIQSIDVMGKDYKQSLMPQILPQQLSVFTPSRPMDGQVVAVFQNQSFQSAVPLLALDPLISQPLLQSSDRGASLFFPNALISPAQIVGFTEAGLPILSVSLPATGVTQLYTMQFAAKNLEVGAPVLIALDPGSMKLPSPLFTEAMDGAFTLDPANFKLGFAEWLKSGQWESLDHLLKALGQMSSVQSQNFLQMLPTPSHPQTLGALGLLFLSLLRSGSGIEEVIGHEALTLLRQMGKSDLIRSVASDMAVASRLENVPLYQDWRMTLLPLVWDSQIYKAPLYYKQFSGDSGDNDSGSDKKRRKLRFLFDLNLSRMGGVQVDGFMQSEQLDIILRTKSALSQSMQTRMKKIYAGAMDKSRLTGNLSFQFKPEQWVDLSQPFEKTGLTV